MLNNTGAFKTSSKTRFSLDAGPSFGIPSLFISDLPTLTLSSNPI